MDMLVCMNEVKTSANQCTNAHAYQWIYPLEIWKSLL